MQDVDQRLDEPTVPLLEDVVDPGDLDLFHPAEVKHPSRISDQQTLIDLLREEVTTQLTEELHPIVSAAVTKAVAQVTDRTKALLLHELSVNLDKRIRQLIDTAVAQEFKKSSSR